MLRRAKLPKNGSHETFLERWHTDADYQKSLSAEGWTEEKIKEHDALALEDHSYEATPQERGRWQGNWKIVLNREGVHGSISQRPDFREAKRALIVDCTSQTIWRNKEDKTLNSNLKVTRKVHPRTGWRYFSFNKFVFILAVAAQQ